MEDEILLAEKVGSLQEQLAAERKKTEKLYCEIRDIQRAHARSHVFQATLALSVIALVIALPVFLGYNYLFHRKNTNHCYIEQSTYQVSGFGVYREVDWGMDTRLAVHTSYPEAFQMLQAQNCEVSK